jgi:hypothetical protein
MLLIRNVFRCKPGCAADLANRFKTTLPLMGDLKARVMVDFVADYWTVVMEMEVEDMATFERQFAQRSQQAEVREKMGDYMSLVTGGHREIYRVV